MGTIDIFAKWDLEKNGWTQSDNSIAASLLK